MDSNGNKTPVVFKCKFLIQMVQSHDNELVANLSQIKKNLSVEDKLRAALELGCSVATIERYLKGQVKKKGFARLLVNHFNSVAA